MGSAIKLELSMEPGWPILLFPPVPELLETPELDDMLHLPKEKNKNISIQTICYILYSM